MIFTNNKTYDILKIIAQIVLPALGTLLSGLAAAWGWDWAPPIVGTIMAVDTFLGAMLKVSSDKYNASQQNGDDVV